MTCHARKNRVGIGTGIGRLGAQGALMVPKGGYATVHHKVATFDGNHGDSAYLSDMRVLEAIMAQKLRKPVSGYENHRQFSPEAEGDFDVVSEREIAEWRAKLAKRFDIGAGNLEVIDEPA